MPRPSETGHVLDAQDLGSLGCALGFAVLLLDGKGRVQDARGDVEQILGRALSRMRGRQLASFIAAGHRYLLEGCLDGRWREFVPLRLAAGPRDAPRWIEMRASRLAGVSEGHGVLIATHEVTQRREGERALLGAVQRQRAGWSERLGEDLSQRVAGVAYKLHAVAASLPSSSTRATAVIAAVGDLAAVVKDMRSLTYEFDPVSDRSGGLRDAVPRLARRLADVCGNGIPVTVHDAAWRRIRLGADLALCWYELLEDLLSEALAEHAVTSVRVTLGREHGALAARVESTGRTRVQGAPGSAPEISPVARERARLLGGTVRRETRCGRISTVATAPR